MPHAGHEAQAIARIYAEALSGLAEEASAADTVLEELRSIVTLLDSVPGLEPLFASPLIDPEARATLLEQHLRGREDVGYGDLVVDTLQVMNRKGRLGLIRELVSTYYELYEAARGVLRIRVVTAVPLTDSQRAAITEVAARITARTPRLEESVDPSLLGGLVLYAGDSKLDSSVRRELDEVAERLIERTSHEMHEGAGRYAEGEI